ncbi:hypothetical protein IJD44_09820 [bacterium]|nr:hypothetical protein [bacterium]
MKKVLKVISLTIITILVILYGVFVLVLPNVVDLNKFMPEIQKMAKEQANLLIDVSSPKIVTTPLLGVGLKAEGITVKFLDGSELVKTGKSIVRVSLPHMIFSTIKITKFDVENPQLTIDILDGKEYKIIKELEKNSAITQTQSPVQDSEKESTEMISLKILVPNVKVTNYAFLINDLKTKDYLKLRGDELVLSYKNGETASVKTLAELFVNETKNISANIDVDTFLPQMMPVEQQVPVEASVDIPFINPVAVYKAYDLKTNVDSKIKVRQKNNQIVSNGFFNVDNLTLNVGGMQLPESNLHIKTKETSCEFDSNLSVTEEEKIILNGLVNYSKNPSLQMKIKSTQIHLENILKLVKAALDSVNIANNLDEIKGEGYFKADTSFKTDFSKLTSEGDITIYDCIVRNSKDNQRIARINSVLSLDNSMLKFVDTYIELFDAVFKIDGTIDEKTNADIVMYMEKMPIKKILTLLAPAELMKNYEFNSGNIDLTAKINGELQKVVADVVLSASNLSVTDKINKISYLNNMFMADFNSDFKTFNGKVTNSDFKLTMNGANVDCEKFVLSVDDKNIVIEPSSIKINNSTIVNLSGDVINYVNNPEFKINADGNLITKDIKKLLGVDLSMYIKEKGSIPLNISVVGDGKQQTIKLTIDANKDNYITFADIQNVLNKDTVLQAVVDLKKDSLKIKETGLFVKNNSGLEEIVGIDGTITKLDTKNPSINLIKLKLPKDITASLVVFPKSKLDIKGSAFISGDLNQPKIKGDFTASNVEIPELFTTVKSATAKFEDNDLDINVIGFVANGSNYDALMKADLTPSTNFVIKNLNLISDYTDADKLMKVSDALIKYTTPYTTATSAAVSTSTSSSNLPVVIKDGSIDIKQIKSGTITLKDTTGKISLSNNIFYLNNLVTTGFDGRISGKVSMNLISGLINANVKGTGLDVEKTLLDAAAMKDTLTGTMDFDANISLKGATYEEQVKSLKGTVDFTMKDGSLGPIGKLENIVAADNIKSVAILSTVVGSVLKSTVDTGSYNTLKGHLTFNNGIAQINPITSAGDYMSAYIFGNFDVLKNYADMKLRGKLSPQATSSMGQLANLNPAIYVKNSAGMNPLLGQVLLKLCEPVSEKELEQIPPLTENSANFQVVIRGDVAQPAKVIRSFKWLALDSEIQEAKEIIGATGTVTIPTSKEELKEQAKQLIKGFLPVSTENEEGSSSPSGKDLIKGFLF